jgi:rare lipoprotein A
MKIRRIPVVALGLAALAGCASGGGQRVSEIDHDSIITPERTRAGNPPVYEVFGETYYTRGDSADYRERGVASWYGEDFHGRSTANGETYNMHALTAAHKTLPIPTWVEVTNLENDRRVIVKVNDRGPFVAGRIIDLSYAAATELDMIRAGTARVEVRALGVPVGGALPGTQVAAAREAEPRPRPRFSLISEAAAADLDSRTQAVPQVFAQVGAFSSRENADRLVGRLRAGGHGDAFVVSESAGAGALHRVRIGPLPGVAAFDDVRRELSELGLRESLLVVIN